MLIIDDGSSDETTSTARQLLTRRDIKVITLSKNYGMGGALRAGFDIAQGSFIATLDADLTFPPLFLKDLYMAAIEKNADLVSGSPHLRSDDLQEVSWLRYLPSLMLNALYRGLFSRALTAYTSVFRLYRASFIKNIPLASNGFEINAEIAVRALLAKRPVVEVPAPLRARTAGVSKLRRGRELKRHAVLIFKLLFEE